MFKNLSNARTFCTLEMIANGSLVHFNVAVERSDEPLNARGFGSKVVVKMLGEDGVKYKPAPFVVTQRSVFCKTQEEVVEVIGQAISAVAEIREIQKAGKLDPMELGYLGA